MRNYPHNSPQAAARLVALVMIADGHVCRSELAALQESGAESALGLRPGELADVLKHLCEDLLTLAEGPRAYAAAIDAVLVEALAGEIDDPALQRQVLSAAELAASADGYRFDAEYQVLTALYQAWGEVSLPLAA